MPTDDERVDELLERWEELRESGETLSAEELCRDCPELVGKLQARIDQLLAIEPFVRSGSASISEQVPLPEWIDSYRVLAEISRGGMGVVYRCQQENPHRDVAVKVMAVWRATPSSLGRFIREVKILGMLHHAGIAQIYEAGTANLGLGPQPFFAMELIDGVALDAFARQRSLDIPARLELLVKVCDAVQHAHERGVIHRDLKPANILVESSGQPKVLDFGVARLTGADSEPLTSLHEGLVPIGSLPYMSPEQAAGESKDLDPRCDVYALGVIAYQLLSGRLPYECQQGTLFERMQAIRDEVPLRLGTINKVCRGDLETIVAKALEKDRDLRYQSVAAFSADVLRSLRGEPILARPASITYRLRRWCRRRPVVAGLSAALAVATVLGVAGIVWQWRRAENTLSQLRDQKVVTEQYLEQSESTLTYLSWAFYESGYWAQDGEAWAADLRRPLAEYYRSVLDRQTERGASPRAAAAAHAYLGQQAAAAGDRDGALGHYDAAVALWRGMLRDEPQRSEYRRALALVLYVAAVQLAGGEAQAANQGVLDANRFVDRFDLSDPTDREILVNYGETLVRNTWVHERAGRFQSAVDTGRAAIRLWERISGQVPQDGWYAMMAAHSHFRLGKQWERLGRPADALSEYQLCRTTVEQLVAKNPGEKVFQAELRDVCLAVGLLADKESQPKIAKGAFEAACMAADELRKFDRRDVNNRDAAARSYFGLARIRRAEGKPDEAGQAFADCRRIWSEMHREGVLSTTSIIELAHACRAVGDLEGKAGRTTEAIAALSQGGALIEEHLRSNPAPQRSVYRDGAQCFEWGATLCAQTGQSSQAIDLRKKAAAIYNAGKKIWPNDSPFLKRGAENDKAIQALMEGSDHKTAAPPEIDARQR